MRYIIPGLALIFIFLKLSGMGVVATWSWWWVLAPIWIPFVLLILLAVLSVVGWMKWG